MNSREEDDSPFDLLRSLLRDLARLRERPCLAIIGELDRSAVSPLLPAIRGVDAEAIDLVVAGPGGDIEAAYRVARTIRRRFGIESAFDDPGIEAFLFGAERIPLDPVRPGLRELQNDRCFFCESRLGARVDVVVLSTCLILP